MVINPIVGVYIPITRIPIKGGMTIPHIATFDHGTYIYIFPGLEIRIENHQFGENSELTIESSVVPDVHVVCLTMWSNM